MAGWTGKHGPGCGLLVTRSDWWLWYQFSRAEQDAVLYGSTRSAHAKPHWANIIHQRLSSRPYHLPHFILLKSVNCRMLPGRFKAFTEFLQAFTDFFHCTAFLQQTISYFVILFNVLLKKAFRQKHTASLGTELFAGFGDVSNKRHKQARAAYLLANFQSGYLFALLTHKFKN